MIVNPCPGACGTEMVRGRVACRDCWQLVPLELRYALRDARQPQQYRERRQAIAQIVAWLGAGIEVSS